MQETLNVIERQEWLEPAGDTIQRGVSSAVSAGGQTGRRLSDFLNGIWLGHPLHPVMTDVPVGAWTVAFALDGVQMLTKTRRFVAGADAALTIGLAGALGAAASGLADWQYTVGRARRVGLAHAILNGAAATLYGVSLACRVLGARKSGQLAALLGFGTVFVSSYLGGDLAYKQRIGPDHAPEQQPPSDFVPVLAERELPDGVLRCVQAGEVSIVLARQGDRVFALANACAHMGGPLCEGTLEDASVVCPWHGSRFALQDGRRMNGPTAYNQPRYETRVRDGLIEVRAQPA